MAWRALLRRVPTRSLTIVGDVAQTSAAGGTHSWATSLDPVLRGTWRLAELTVNYRTPAAVARAAQRVGAAAGLPVGTLTSAREVPDALVVERVAADALVGTAVARALAAVDRVVDVGGAGRVALIVARGRLDGVRAALAAAGGPVPADGGSVDLDAPLDVLTPVRSKGLEFDAVVLLEPAELLAAAPADLYVAMTRPTTTLHVVHAADLPTGFDDTDG